MAFYAIATTYNGTSPSYSGSTPGCSRLMTCRRDCNWHCNAAFPRRYNRKDLPTTTRLNHALLPRSWIIGTITSYSTLFPPKFIIPIPHTIMTMACQASPLSYLRPAAWSRGDFRFRRFPQSPSETLVAIIVGISPLTFTLQEIKESPWSTLHYFYIPDLS